VIVVVVGDRGRDSIGRLIVVILQSHSNVPNTHDHTPRNRSYKEITEKGDR